MPISELSRRVGVSTDTLRAWERRYGVLKPRRTAGNARRYTPVDEARIRLMKRYLEQRVPTAQAAELATAALFSVRPGQVTGVSGDDARRTAREMRDALDRFDETSAQRALEKLFAEYSTTTVIGDVLLPYLRDLGERWAANHVTVAQEHFASNFLHARLMALARGWDRGLGPRALLACAPGEQHTFGLIAFGIALHHLGWRITYLGAATPTEMLPPTAQLIGADLVVVSASACADLQSEVAALATVAGRWPVWLAGAGATAELAAACAARHLDADPITAAGVAAGRGSGLP
jgi:MerR family transcriptional regulator, light-induced transcriptional regulator